MHAIVGCAGAAAQNANCASGAAGAGLGSLFNSLMADDKKASAEEKEARNNLINALVAGVVTGLGGDAAAASTAARIEAENNALYAKSKEVSKVLTPKVQELEQAFVQGEIAPEHQYHSASNYDQVVHEHEQWLKDELAALGCKNVST